MNKEQFLIENYSKMSCAELAEVLGYKNAQTVRTVAHRLGIKKLYDTDDLPREEWRIHPEYPQHLISNRGRVKSLDRNKLISTRIHEGYFDCRINDKDGRKRSPRIHRLVADVFVLNPNNLAVVNHIDGDKTNNDANNLEWVTHSTNAKHAQDNGLVGVRSDTLEEASVREICAKLSEGLSIQQIMALDKSYTRSRVEKIRQRRRWTKVSGAYRW